MYVRNRTSSNFTMFLTTHTACTWMKHKIRNRSFYFIVLVFQIQISNWTGTKIHTPDSLSKLSGNRFFHKSTIPRKSLSTLSFWITRAQIVMIESDTSISSRVGNSEVFLRTFLAVSYTDITDSALNSMQFKSIIQLFCRVCFSPRTFW